MRVGLKTALSLCAVVLSTAGCASSDALRAEPLELMEEHRISNPLLSVGICRRDAGAVCSIVYDGHEFVNDYDHGRQLQIAWSYNDLGEAYNPTEAGSGDDFTKPTSTSKLLSVRVEGATLVTESHPAYWQRVGQGRNIQETTQDTLRKKITLGYGGDLHVIVVDAEVTISPELTGPPIRKIRIEAPAFYTSSALTEHYQLDRRDGSMLKIPPPARPEARHTGMNDRMRLNTERQRIAILSSPDGKYAAGVYTPQVDNFWTYSSYSIPRDLPANACNKVTARFEHAADTGRTYSYRSFVVIGDLATVKNAAMNLP